VREKLLATHCLGDVAVSTVGGATDQHRIHQIFKSSIITIVTTPPNQKNKKKDNLHDVL